MKRKIIVFFLIILVLTAVFCSLLYFSKNPESSLYIPALNAQIEKVKDIFSDGKGALLSNQVTLYLKNKSVISGGLVSDEPDKITIRWGGGEVSFLREEIARVEYGKAIQDEGDLLFPVEKKEWSYKNDIVVQLTNQVVLDARIIEVESDKIIIQYPLEEGGAIEQEIERNKIENLLFKPVKNELSQNIEKNLRHQFSKKRVYQEGIFTIITDSSTIWVKDYKKILRRHLTEFYLTYFPLLKNRKPSIQNFIVVFDSFNDYVEYAITDGVPGWLAAGYFNPLDKVLYLSNALSAEIEEIMYDVILAKSREYINILEDMATKRAGERYRLFIEGQANEMKAKFVQVYNIIKGTLRRSTLTVLRHEVTHELFHNWGLQNVIVSKTKVADKRLADKKKEYLETEDIEKKRKLLLGLLSQRRDEEESYEAEAANSWFVEGTATYSEKDPIGELNDRWLFVFQEARRKNMLLPLEQLTVYSLGSFPGVATETLYYAYAQSWAFTYFLMKNYPDQFLSYLERMTREKAKDDEDLMWLLEALDKDLRQIEGEFLAYMEQFEERESPDIKYFGLLYDIFHD